MRGMVQCRFSWGCVVIYPVMSFCKHALTRCARLYGAAIPSILNVISSMGFLILNGIIGGQAMAAVSSKLDDTLGIVIIGIIASVVGILNSLLYGNDNCSHTWFDRSHFVVIVSYIGKKLTRKRSLFPKFTGVFISFNVTGLKATHGYQTLLHSHFC